MESLGQLGVAAAELFEAEGRSLRRNLMRVGVAIGFGLVLLLLAAVGIGFLVWGIYLMLAQIMPPSDAAVVLGLTALVFSAAGVWSIKRSF